MNRKLRIGLSDAGPIIGDEDGVAGVGWIIFDAGRLAGRQPLQAKALLEAGNVLRGFIGDTGNGIAISYEAPQTACAVPRRRGFAP